ncbi:WAT1-related At3g28050-like [Olea europaea subsp. europaea]|uniref:WAT1-related protein n=1 Tax=Olea europaea subsp. europaea TaxID=158383 RepID=A0A8S0QZY4_OLEEU|nr:WAT1-related At3g28050-like [Olea europaea subsp. europaea]
MGIERVFPYVGMVIVQFAQVGLMIAGKVAMSNGMTTFTFAFYSNALASLILLPISFWLHRSARPPLFYTFICGFFLLGLIGFLVQIFGYTGLMYATASLSSAMMNLIPGFTFILAIIFRLEKFDCKSSGTLAKSIGTIVSIIGAFIITLYKGPTILGISSHSIAPIHTLTQSSAWLIGGLLLAIDSVVASVFIIAQALVLRKYPAVLLLMLFYSCFIAILSAAVSLTVERDTKAWSLKPMTRLIPVIYSGMFGNVFQVSMIMWCMRRRGPLFASMFHPLGVVIAIVMGIIFLGEAFYLGSLLGSIVVSIGFYSVMWGKAKEGKMVHDDREKSSESNDKKTPLLQKKVEDGVVIV